MTDIYIRSRNSSKKPVIIALLILAGIALLIVWSKGCSAKKAEMAEQESIEEGELIQITEHVEKPVRTSEPAQEAPQPPPRIPTETGSRFEASVQALLKENKLQEARKLCYEVLESAADEDSVNLAEDFLSNINITLVHNRYPMEEKIEYTIESGDSLDKLAKKYKTTIQLIQDGNGITGSRIRIGDRFRILTGVFSLKVDTTKNIMKVYLNDRFFKKYRVGTGKFDRTPSGEFTIVDRIAQPTWYRPDGKSVPYGDPENVLGTHWLSLDLKSYGIHGTWAPETIGKKESQGCIRLLNQDIEELYGLLPVGTKVTIEN